MHSNDIPTPSTFPDPKNRSSKVITETNLNTHRQIGRIIWDSDGPISLISKPNQQEPLTEFLQNQDQSYRVVNFKAKASRGLVSRLRICLAREFEGCDTERMASSDPEEWCFALRQVIKEDAKGSGTNVLIIEAFDEILKASKEDAALFSSILSHLACENQISVLMISAPKSVARLSKFLGFEYLAESGTSEIVTVPESWLPPQLSGNTLAKDYQESRPTEKSFFNSHLLFGAAMIVAFTTVTVSLWVMEELETNTALAPAHQRKIEPFERTAKVTTLNLASPTQLQWTKNLDINSKEVPNFVAGPDENRAADFIFDPIPVTLGISAENGESAYTTLMAAPGDELEPARKGSVEEVVIPDWAHYSTEESYLNSLLSFEDYPYHSIVVPDNHIDNDLRDAPQVTRIASEARENDGGGVQNKVKNRKKRQGRNRVESGKELQNDIKKGAGKVPAPSSSRNLEAKPHSPSIH